MFGHLGAGSVFQFKHVTEVVIEGLNGYRGCRVWKNEDSIHEEASQFLYLA